MKKRSPKKMELNKETIRHLLVNVSGGEPPLSDACSLYSDDTKCKGGWGGCWAD
jgi:hypothetical protein